MSFICVIYYNGHISENEQGRYFYGEKKRIRISRGIEYDVLKQKIHSKLKLNDNQIISKLTLKYVSNINPTIFDTCEISDDEDVECMFDGFERQYNMQMLELYVDIEVVGPSGNICPEERFFSRGATSSHYVSPPTTACYISPPNVVVPPVDCHASPPSNHPDSNVDFETNLSEDDGNGENDGNESSTDEEGDVNVGVGSPFDLHAVPTHDAGPSHTPFWTGVPHYTYIDWSHPDQEILYSGLDVAGSWRVGDEMYVGLRFHTKNDVQMALKHYSMNAHQTFVVLESGPRVLSVRCPNYNEGCPWRVRASMSTKMNNKWVIRNWGGKHTCMNAMLSQDHKKLDSEFICCCILGMVREDASVSISLIQERISGQFNYKVSYRKAWKAKQKAIDRVFGDWGESYDLLPRWLDRMIECCPGSAYKLETTEYVTDYGVDPRFRQFRRVFWTFKPACDAFDYCKPILQIDGTFLYGKYRGTLLIATTQDGNSRVLPVAFAIVEGETLSDWSWFLSNIRRYVTQKQGICLISDRHQSIKSAVANAQATWQPPHAYHVYCIRHIASNFNHRFKNVKLKEELIQLGYTTSKHTFERRLERFREISPEIRRWIDGISLEKWAICHDEEGRRYGHMTTNLSEAVNKILKGARNLPITALVKLTYARLVEYFVQRLGQATSEVAMGQHYCQKLLDAMRTNQEEASSYFVRRYNYESTRFEVEECFNTVTGRGGKTYNVYLNERKCECGAFQAYRYPCSHVIAACAHVRVDPLTYVDGAYTNNNIIQAYSGQWFPLGSDDNIQPNQGIRIIPNEGMLRAKGRPKSTRIRNEMDWTESQRRQRCGHCRGEGHNRSNCPSLTHDQNDNP